MSSVQSLREFISERLTAAAEEIFTEFEKTIVRYEEEIDRQRRLLDISWKPHTHLHTTELPQHILKEEKILTEQQLCNQERNTSLDQEEPGPPQMKEDQEEPEPPPMKEDQKEAKPPKIKEDHEAPESSQMMKYYKDPNFPHNQEKQGAPEPPKDEPEFLEIKEEPESETCTVMPGFHERNQRELKPNFWDQLLSQNSPKVENQDQERSRNVERRSCRDDEPKQIHRNLQTKGYGDDVDRPNVKIDQKTHLLFMIRGKKIGEKHNLRVHMRYQTGKELIQYSTAKREPTLFLLDLRFGQQSDSLLQYP
ncbi:uncharacterized protein LOC119430392 [Nematolebias whitei]|uniref:uncharacterized protein LOC119430392 n=1 Tax=Nematolebias whitei TaxID=451745 RepID=UPI00189BAA2C|nr:uncharacterized protein LOC119430392 [Nematolebias whitei]